MTSAPSDPKPSEGGLPNPQRALAMLTICMGVILTSVDSVIANIALPTISDDLHASPASTIWAVTAYQLAVTVCILPLASLGERLGYRRVYLAGLTTFTIASLGCTFAHNLPMLVVFRALQGVGGAGLVSGSLAIVRFIYPRDRMGRGFGLYATTVAASMAAGPGIAAAILSLAHWPWLFAVNVPTGIAAVAIGLRTLPRIAASGPPLDITAALINAAALGLIVIGTDGLGLAADRPLAIAELVAGIGLMGLLVVRERARSRPMLPVDLLAIRLFRLSAITATMAYSGLLMAFVALPFYLQMLTGREPAGIGLLITPWPLGIVLGAQLTGRLADRYPAGILASSGLIVLASGAAALALLPTSPSDANVIWRMALCGLGFGFFQTPNNRAMMIAGPPERSGAASGMLATCRLLGMSMGAAMAAVLFAALDESAGQAALWGTVVIALTASVASASRLKRK